LENYRSFELIHWNKEIGVATTKDLVAEEPLSIRIEDKSYVSLLRTPGNERAHVAGFSLTEGIVDDPDDILSIAFSDAENPHVITLTLTPSRLEKISYDLEKKSFAGQPVFGLSSEEMINMVARVLEPLNESFVINAETAVSRLDRLNFYQPLREKTNATHAAVSYSLEYEMLSVAEDVGRHNAVDKAIGEIFLGGDLPRAAFLTLSSRISYELVLKAARARIPIILSISRPTAMAVELAVRLNMTLACFSRDDGLFIFTGKDRIIF
jgi:FdhD protein